MSFRLIETQTNDVIVTMNKTALLKFIGWCEAHRPSDYEPSFLGHCLLGLEHANEGCPLDATAECAACGETYSLLSADVHLYRDGDWYCKDRDTCNERSSVTCAGCGTKYHSSDPGVLYDPDVNGWFCKNSEKCNQRRMEGAA
jgi:hypothetical protein